MTIEMKNYFLFKKTITFESGNLRIRRNKYYNKQENSLRGEKKLEQEMNAQVKTT